MLLAARAAQGVGAALLLAGSLPVLVALVPGRGRGRRWWALAAAVGAAIGPALGGVLTELFSWRAIFLVQAPIVAGALGGGRRRHRARVSRDAGRATADRTTPPQRRDHRQRRVRARVRGTRRRAVPRRALAIEVWRYSPAQSALLVSALPLGMLLGRVVQPAPGAGRSPSAARCCSRWARRAGVRARRRAGRRPPSPSRSAASGSTSCTRCSTRAAVPAGRATGSGRRRHDRGPPCRPRARAGADRAGAVVEPRRRASNGPRSARRRPCCSPNCRCPTSCR